MAKNGNKRRMVSRPSSSARAAERPGILFQLAGLDSAYSDLLRTVFEHMAEEEKSAWPRMSDFAKESRPWTFSATATPTSPCSRSSFPSPGSAAPASAIWNR